MFTLSIIHINTQQLVSLFIAYSNDSCGLPAKTTTSMHACRYITLLFLFSIIICFISARI